MFFFVWFFVPETKGISLEAMDKLFGVTEETTTKLVDGPSDPVNDEKTATVQVDRPAQPEVGTAKATV